MGGKLYCVYYKTMTGTLILIIIIVICVYYIIQRSNKLIDCPSADDEPNDGRIHVKYRGNTYDITDYAIKHPGGKEILMQNQGKDIEHLMIEQKHSKHAYRILEGMKVDE